MSSTDDHPPVTLRTRASRVDSRVKIVEMVPISASAGVATKATEDQAEESSELSSAEEEEEERDESGKSAANTARGKRTEPPSGGGSAQHVGSRKRSTTTRARADAHTTLENEASGTVVNKEAGTGSKADEILGKTTSESETRIDVGFRSKDSPRVKRMKTEPTTPTRRIPRSTRTTTAVVDLEDLTPPPSTSTATTTEARRNPKKERSYTPTKIKLSLDKPHPEPKGWRRQYELIERMRERIVAPVDTLGCETPNRERTDDPKTIRFHMLISLCLSSQTKDEVTSQAVTNLHNALPGGLTAQSLADASPELIASCINKVGFWRRKTEYIHEAAKRIVAGGLDDGEPSNPDVDGITEEPGDIPRTLGGLCKLKGVGPKMAFLALQCAWHINAGVGVDVHVHRITNRLGWHKPKTTEPEQTRLNLQSWLPPHLFKPINHVLVGFGQVVCLPVGPRCDVCLLAKEKVCPSRVANVNTKNRKVVEFGFLDDEDNVKAAIELEVESTTEPTVKTEFEDTSIVDAEQLADVVMNELAEEKGLRVVKAEAGS